MAGKDGAGKDGGRNSNPEIVGLGPSTHKKWVLVEKKVADIGCVLGDSDINKLKNEAIDITCIGSTFDEMVELLLKKKAEGINCFFVFNNVKIYSIDVENQEDAHLLHLGGGDKAEGKRWVEENEKRKKGREEREEKYMEMVMKSREGLTEVEITKEKVVAGLKFIAEHQDMGQKQLVSELINLGCNFTFEDFERQFPEGVDLFPDMEVERGELLQWGAYVIANVMLTVFGKSYCYDNYLRSDHSSSVYACVRALTGDNTYTKKYVDSLVSEQMMKK